MHGLKQGDALSPLLFNFALEYAIRKIKETNLGLDMNGTHQVLAYADDVNLKGDDFRKNRKKCRCVIKCLSGHWFSSKHSGKLNTWK